MHEQKKHTRGGRFLAETCSRRSLLKIAGLGALCCLAPRSLFAAIPPRQKLQLVNTHTRERLLVQLGGSGGSLSGSMEEINHLLRDHYSDEVHPIDPSLLRYLRDVTQAVKYSGEVHIICGYRSPKTNAMLRKKSKGVAKNSLHIQGKAVDFRLPGISAPKIAQAARSLKRGGCGLYTRSNFVHIDTGSVRCW